MKTNAWNCEGLALRLIKARNRQGLTSKQLAEKIKVSPSVICYIESERNGATISTILKICKALDVSSDYLLGLQEDMNARTAEG